MTVTVGVVEDHPLYRLALVSTVERAGWHVQFAVDSVEAASAALTRSDVDVLLLDVTLPDGDGRDLLALAVERDVVTIIVSSNDHAEVVAAAERGGAMAFVAKSADDGVIQAVVRDALRGRRTFPTIKITDHSGGAAASPLTDREHQVLVLAAEGLSNREIAEVLDIGHETVKSHVASVLVKTSSADRTQAVAVALRRGWI